jgi:hypothetical protein
LMVLRFVLSEMVEARQERLAVWGERYEGRWWV